MDDEHEIWELRRRLATVAEERDWFKSRCGVGIGDVRRAGATAAKLGAWLAVNYDRNERGEWVHGDGMVMLDVWSNCEDADETDTMIAQAVRWISRHTGCDPWDVLAEIADTRTEPPEPCPVAQGLAAAMAEHFGADAQVEGSTLTVSFAPVTTVNVQSPLAVLPPVPPPRKPVTYDWVQVEVCGDVALALTSDGAHELQGVDTAAVLRVFGACGYDIAGEFVAQVAVVRASKRRE